MSADLMRLGEEIAAVEKAGADLLHLDIMDGQFVPNITYGPVLFKSAKNYSSLPLDVHLMIIQPEQFIPRFAEIGADMITVHKEATAHLDRLIQRIKSFGVKAGVSINPATSVETIFPVLNSVDHVLIMSVNPGFGGQRFIPYTLEKVRILKDYITQNKLSVDIEIDGGVTPENAREIIDAGAEILVAGSAVFGSKDYAQSIKQLRNP